MNTFYGFLGNLRFFDNFGGVFFTPEFSHFIAFLLLNISGYIVENLNNCGKFGHSPLTLKKFHVNNISAMLHKVYFLFAFYLNQKSTLLLRFLSSERAGREQFHFFPYMQDKSENNHSPFQIKRLMLAQ